LPCQDWTYSLVSSEDTMPKDPMQVTTTSAPPIEIEAASIIRTLALGVLVALGITAMGASVGIWGIGKWWRPLSAGLFIGFGVVTILALIAALETGWRHIERMTGRDIDQSGAVGDGLVLLRARGAPAADAALVDEFGLFVQGCAIDTSTRRWESLGRVKYQAYRDRLIDAGWAEWASDDHRAGWRLTAEPDEILRSLG